MVFEKLRRSGGRDALWLCQMWIGLDYAAFFAWRNTGQKQAESDSRFHKARFPLALSTCGSQLKSKHKVTNVISLNLFLQVPRMLLCYFLVYKVLV